MGAIILQFPDYPVGDDTLNFRIKIAGQPDLSSESWDADQKKIYITEVDDLQVGIDLNDSLMSSSDLKFKVVDVDGELANYIFLEPLDRAIIEPEISLTLRKNSVEFFFGYLVTELCEYDEIDKVLDLTFIASIARLYEIGIKDDDGNYIDYFGYGVLHYMDFYLFLTHIFSEISQFDTVNVLPIELSWTFNTSANDGDLTDLLIWTERIYRNGSVTAESLADVVKNLMRCWACVGALLPNGDVIIQPFFYGNTSGAQTPETVLDKKRIYEYDEKTYYKAKANDGGSSHELGQPHQFDDKRVIAIQDFWFRPSSSTGTPFYIQEPSPSTDKNPVLTADVPGLPAGLASTDIEVRLWYNSLSNFGVMMATEFKVTGLNYTVFKLLQIDGVYYRPVSIRYHLTEGTSTIIAIKKTW